jgi:hypothetical protein
MARTGAIKHTHQYFKGSNGVWACARDGCTHFLPGNMANSTPVGKKSICWNESCSKEFIVSLYNMNTNQPRCDECTMQFDELSHMLDNKFKDMDEDPYLKRALQKQAEERAKLKIVDKPESEDV